MFGEGHHVVGVGGEGVEGFDGDFGVDAEKVGCVRHALLHAADSDVELAWAAAAASS